MASQSSTDPAGGARSAAWASWLGAVAVILGVFLTAVHANELLKQVVLVRNAPPDGRMPAAVCPEEELEEEGLTAAECEHMVTNVGGLILSAPAWFAGFMAALSLAGTIVAFLSIVAGAALVGGRAWAPVAAAATFGALAAVDAAGFVAAVNAGPILRQLYLAERLLWLLIHLMMTLGAIAGMRFSRAARAA
ncbi:MAG: hypothetical protein JXB36_07785 [Gammaproteobacteria bacterium]|nr:hypothetical protein [Gammaproteobacteria bacterium]